jgi:hypothetical protein
MKTWSISFSSSISFIGRLLHSAGIVWDDKGNIGLIETKGYGGGTPSAALVISLSSTNGDTIFSLTDLGYEVGASVSGVVVPMGIGYDRIGGNGYHGWNLEFGLIATPIPVEMHGTVTNTSIPRSNNPQPSTRESYQPRTQLSNPTNLGYGNQIFRL